MQNIQKKSTKLNKPNQTYQTKYTKPILPNQTYQTYQTKNCENSRNFLLKDGNQTKLLKPKNIAGISTDQCPLAWLLSYNKKPPFSWIFPGLIIEIYSKQNLFALVDIGAEELWFKVQLFIHACFHRPLFARSLLR